MGHTESSSCHSRSLQHRAQGRGGSEEAKLGVRHGGTQPAEWAWMSGEPDSLWATSENGVMSLAPSALAMTVSLGLGSPVGLCVWGG